MALLLVASPLLLAIALLVACTSRGPVLFLHRRIGRDGRPFAILKFRTMRDGSRGAAVTSKGDPRVTAVGRLLRATKLDELPELWNVLRGDMALVGPRPEAAEYVDPSNAAWRAVLSVRPGVTHPVTLRLRNEEQLLKSVGPDHEAFYRRYLVPFKLRGYRQYLDERTWQRDLAVLWATALGILIPARVPPPSLEEIVWSERGDGGSGAPSQAAA